MEQELFARHTALADKLISFGFIKKGKDFFYQEAFHRGAFRAEITVHTDSSVTGRVIDSRTGAEYSAVHVEEAVGSFVGAIRQEYKQILLNVRTACFSKDPFLFAQSNRIAGALAEKYQEYPDYPFSELPHYGVFRYPKNRKWYGLIMNIPKYRLLKDKKVPKDETIVEILNLKVDSKQVDALLKTKGFYPCYHMNRANWISILLDGTVPDKTISALLETSRNFVVGTASRELGKPTSWLIPANPKYYDVVRAFDAEKEIDWKQGAGIKTGDTIYLYVGSPISAILYKCRVTETDIPYHYQDENLTIKALMKIKLLKRYDKDSFTFKVLNDEYGIFAVRGPRGVPFSLSEALNNE